MPVLRIFTDVSPGTTNTATEYVPANGEKVYLKQISTQAPANSNAKGSLVWDGQTLEGWSADKVVDLSSETPLVGDGAKKLQLKLENNSLTTTMRIGASLTYELG
jgi:hypothetical protein